MYMKPSSTVRFKLRTVYKLVCVRGVQYPVNLKRTHAERRFHSSRSKFKVVVGGHTSHVQKLCPFHSSVTNSPHTWSEFEPTLGSYWQKRFQMA